MPCGPKYASFQFRFSSISTLQACQHLTKATQCAFQHAAHGFEGVLAVVSKTFQSSSGCRSCSKYLGASCSHPPHRRRRDGACSAGVFRRRSSTLAAAGGCASSPRRRACRHVAWAQCCTATCASRVRGRRACPRPLADVGSVHRRLPTHALCRQQQLSRRPPPQERFQEQVQALHEHQAPTARASWQLHGGGRARAS